MTTDGQDAPIRPTPAEDVRSSSPTVEAQRPREEARGVLNVVADRMDEFAYDEISCAIDTLADAHEVAEDALATLRSGIEALVHDGEHADTCALELSPGAGYPCNCWCADALALLAQPSTPASTTKTPTADWPFGAKSAAHLVARVAWPNDSQIDEWSPRLLAETEIRDLTIAQAKARFDQAVRAITAHIETGPRS